MEMYFVMSVSPELELWCWGHFSSLWLDSKGSPAWGEFGQNLPNGAMYSMGNAVTQLGPEPRIHALHFYVSSVKTLILNS